jgi:hypothetical protein
MPSSNSGTERPRAPLLEPYITLVLAYITEEFFLDRNYINLKFSIKKMNFYLNL